MKIMMIIRVLILKVVSILVMILILIQITMITIMMIIKIQMVVMIRMITKKLKIIMRTTFYIILHIAGVFDSYLEGIDVNYSNV